jgi:hypothetical protein
MSKMTWTRDYSGHYTAEGTDHTYVLSSQPRGWDLVVLDAAAFIVVARHHENRKIDVAAIAARYERGGLAERQALRQEFRS